MRQKLEKMFRSGGVVAEVVQSPLGLTIVGGIVGAGATYLFGRTQLAQDLVHAQADKLRLEERISTLENENSDLSRQNKKWSEIINKHLIKNGNLRDQLQKNGLLLSDCKQNKHNIETAFRNSLCFWPYYVNKDPKVTDIKLTNGSEIKNRRS